MDYTRVPNFFFDCMADMDRCEQSIVLLIIRRTLGYQKEWDRISFSQFQEAAGVAPASVEKGIKAAIERGIVERRGAKNSYEYRICEPQNTSKNVVIDSENTTENEVILDKNTTKTEVKNDTENEVIRENTSENVAKSLQKLKTQKKKERTTTTSLLRKAAPRPLLNGGSPPEHQRMFAKICDIVGWDSKTLDEKGRGRVGQTLGILEKAGYTLADLDRFGPDVWAHDWRWTKNKDRPTLTQLRQEIGKLRAPKFKANGVSAGGEKTWAEKFASQDIPDYILKMQRGEGP